MLLVALLGLCLTMAVSHGTPVGATLRRWLVEAPADRLSRITRGHVLFGLLTLSIVASVIWLLDNDGRMLVTMGLPDFLSFAAAVDLSALLDLAAVAVIAATTIRFRAVGAWVRQTVTPRRPRARRPRVKRQRPPANDGERRPALAA